MLYAFGNQGTDDHLCLRFTSYFLEDGQKCMAWGVSGGRGQPQAAHPLGGSPLEMAIRPFQGLPTLERRRAWHDRV
jgi:hypothetical protein